MDACITAAVTLLETEAGLATPALVGTPLLCIILATDLKKYDIFSTMLRKLTLISKILRCQQQKQSLSDLSRKKFNGQESGCPRARNKGTMNS